MSEKTLYDTSPSLRKPCVVSILCAVALLISRYATNFNDSVEVVLYILLGLVACKFLLEYIKHSFIRYRITDHFVEISEGFISRKIRRTPWARITNFTQVQSFSGRILGLSNILVDMPGHEELEIEFRDVSNSDTEEILKLFEEYVPDAQEDSSEHSASTKA